MTKDNYLKFRRQSFTTINFLIIFFPLIFLAAEQSFAQGGVDANTLLLLRFENMLSGEQGEAPTENAGLTFEPGVLGQGVLVDGTDMLRYPTAGNFNASTGTIEFWVKPRQTGTVPSNFCYFCMGPSPYVNGSMILQIDGAGLINHYVNVPHGSTLARIDNWSTSNWHYVAVAWNYPGNVKIYVDGEERFSRPSVAEDVIAPVPDSLTIGSMNSIWQANAVIDELRVSNIARSPQEIAARYVSALNVNSIALQTITQNPWKTWRITPKITASTHVGAMNIPPSAASWTSSNPNAAVVNANGQIVAVDAGTAVLTATVNGAQANLAINVRAPVLPPRVNIISDYLKTPAPGSLYEIPVVIIRYLPTTDGTTLDVAYAPDFYTLNPVPLSVLEPRLDDYDKNVKFMLEEGSRFRGYGSQAPAPSLGYRVVASITFYEPTPPGKTLGTSQGFPLYAPEYFQIFERLGLENYVNNLGVKEVWFWQGLLAPNYPSFNPNIHLPENFRELSESNMSSSATGDISNSLRDNSDLPIYNKTYVVYGNNIRRTQAEAVHNHGHQLESILGYANQRQAGNTEMFWQKFVGRDANFNWQRGRAGDTHHPPHVLNDYDYENYAPFPSDIMDWKPDGGQSAPFSASTYGNIPYAFPALNPPQRIESQWYIFWMQSMPGRGNQIPLGTNRMTNWWQFTADWDRAIRAGIGLYEPASCTLSLSASGQNFQTAGGSGSVNVAAGTGCRWFASSNASWIQITSGETGNNGNTTVNFTVLANTTGNTRSANVIIGGQIFSVTQSGVKTRFDFDGDGKADVSVFRPENGAWYRTNSSNNSFFGISFGQEGDLITPADFDGDGRADIAVFRPSNGVWYRFNSSTNQFVAIQFGASGDIPMPGDFDADGKADISVWRPSLGNWFRLNSSNGEFVAIQFGTLGDKPQIADIDGDGKSDPTVYRPSNGIWYSLRSSNNTLFGINCGISTDIPTAADYDGDGKTNVSVYRPSNGTWYRFNSTNNQFIAEQFGANGDVPTPADYDGDGRADISVFRPSNGVWYQQRSSLGFFGQQFGTNGDIPTPSAFGQ